VDKVFITADRALEKSKFLSPRLRACPQEESMRAMITHMLFKNMHFSRKTIPIIFWLKTHERQKFPHYPPCLLLQIYFKLKNI
jgi:hypothetical protein